MFTFELRIWLSIDATGTAPQGGNQVGKSPEAHGENQGEFKKQSWPPGSPWGLRLKWAKGRFGSKNDEKVKVLRMEFSVVEKLSGPQESIFSRSRSPQLHFGKKMSNYIKFMDFLLFPLFGVPWAAVIYTSRKEIPETSRQHNEA